MFDKFGELDSFEELNKTAEGFFNEGDIESILELAKENGIPQDYVQMYIDGMTPQFCDPLTAAIGKIEVECEELKPTEIMADWVEYIKGRCNESEKIALAVRKKGKTLKGCIGELLRWSFANCYEINADIKAAAGVSGRVKMGIPGMGRAKKIIRTYYLED